MDRVVVNPPSQKSKMGTVMRLPNLERKYTFDLFLLVYLVK